MSCSPDADRLVASAVRVRLSECSAERSYSELSEDRIEKIVSGVLAGGDLSPLEHAVYTFSVDGVSRIATHQLARHRMASFSQRSQGEARLGREAEFVMPDRIREDDVLRPLFEKLSADSMELYETMLRRGISREDARYALPASFASGLIMTMNARELLCFFSVRCCKKSPWEIRSLAWKMLREVMKASPAIFRNAGPECVSSRRCPYEDMKCFGKMRRVWETEEFDR